MTQNFVIKIFTEEIIKPDELNMWSHSNRATLDTYTNKMKGHGHTHPAPVYGTMVEVLKKGFETL